MGNVTIDLTKLVNQVSSRNSDEVGIDHPITVQIGNGRVVEIPTGEYHLDGNNQIHLVAPIQ